MRLGGLNLWGVLIALGVALVFGLLSLLTAWWVSIAILLVLLVLLGGFLLAANKTEWGRALAMKLGARLFRTRLGKRMAAAQLKSQAERAGIETTDRLGRKLTEVELQLELSDAPEAQLLKKQLRAMSPQQRAQALRMMQVQMEQATKSGQAPDDMRGRTERRGGGQPRPRRQGKLK